jgi:hypothetical protein
VPAIQASGARDPGRRRSSVTGLNGAAPPAEVLPGGRAS